MATSLLSRNLVGAAAFVALSLGSLQAQPQPADHGQFFKSSPTSDASLATIPASDSRFLYEGRFDTTKPSAPVDVWEGNRISVDFEGSRVALLFEDLEGQCFFDAHIDGQSHIVALRDPAQHCYELTLPLGPGRHHLMLFKRSEATAGTVAFRGIEIAKGARAWAPAKPAYALKMEFIGDSITVGACNEDGPADQWDDRLTHDNALSYGAVTADAFHADYRCIAVSGMGICTGYVPMLAGQIWDRVYPRVDSPRADLSAWTPDVVFVNFGENDNSFTSVHHQPFPAGFTAGYVALIHAIRSAYPKSEIVLLRGGMTGGAKSEVLREAWTKAVDQLEAADPRVSHFVFTHWTGTHPRVKDDRIMADELSSWLRGQPFMAGR
ncbi:endoglucanase E precursor [mine drainage metagenome]|uniref:Endoglucanase E n=1 Tax=mine drainage metagenome TaxID=410659 RepID=A0A1J5S421_9ZZZZ